MNTHIYKIPLGDKHNTQKDVSEDPHPGLAGHWPRRQTHSSMQPSVNANK